LLVDESLARYFLSERESEAPLPRARVYRQLVRGSLRAALDEFPMTVDVLGEDRFRALVDRFLDAGGPSTSLYRDVPADLVAWAQEIEHPLADLLQFEWLDLVAARHPADLDEIARGDAGLVRPNPTIQIGVFGRPVDEMSAESPEPVPFEAPIAYLVWRRPKTDEIERERVGLLVARALACAMEAPVTVKALSERLGEEVPGLALDEVEASLEEACRGLRARDGLL
jgi:hypothetical protein